MKIEKAIFILGKTKVITDLIIDTKAIKKGDLFKMVSYLNDDIYNFIEEETK